MHRHEQTDEPAFSGWLAATFGRLISAVRDLAQQVEAKSRLVESIEAEAFFNGRSPAAIWRDMQRPRPDQKTGAPETGSGGHPPPWDEEPDTMEDRLDEEMNRFFEQEGVGADHPFAEAFRNAARNLLGVDAPGTRAPGREARAIYRRLVQLLHPDRGGAWTPARARLWEQVQQAWQEGDADWLARLEVEWETSGDLLGPTSSLGRLQAAGREIEAARRDAERRVRAYRQHPAWRFSLRPPSAELKTTTERQLRHDREMFQMQLDEIEAVLARWQRPPSRRGRKGGRRAHASQLPIF